MEKDVLDAILGSYIHLIKEVEALKESIEELKVFLESDRCKRTKIRDEGDQILNGLDMENQKKNGCKRDQTEPLISIKSSDGICVTENNLQRKSENSSEVLKGKECRKTSASKMFTLMSVSEERKNKRKVTDSHQKNKKAINDESVSQKQDHLNNACKKHKSAGFEVNPLAGQAAVSSSGRVPAYLISSTQPYAGKGTFKNAFYISSTQNKPTFRKLSLAQENYQANLSSNLGDFFSILEKEIEEML